MQPCAEQEPPRQWPPTPRDTRLPQQGARVCHVDIARCAEFTARDRPAMVTNTSAKRSSKLGYFSGFHRTMNGPGMVWPTSLAPARSHPSAFDIRTCPATRRGRRFRIHGRFSCQGARCTPGGLLRVRSRVTPCGEPLPVVGRTAHMGRTSRKEGPPTRPLVLMIYPCEKIRKQAISPGSFSICSSWHTSVCEIASGGVSYGGAVSAATRRQVVPPASAS